MRKLMYSTIANITSTVGVFLNLDEDDTTNTNANVTTHVRSQSNGGIRVWMQSGVEVPR